MKKIGLLVSTYKSSADTANELLLPVSAGAALYSGDDPVLSVRDDGGENKHEGQLICGFSMETEDLIENSRKKLLSKNCTMIAANSIAEQGAGFGTDTNKITLITRSEIRELAMMSKTDAANHILDELLRIGESME